MNPRLHKHALTLTAGRINQSSLTDMHLQSNEPVELEKQPVEVEDVRKITDFLRGIYGNVPQIDRGNSER